MSVLLFMKNKILVQPIPNNFFSLKLVGDVLTKNEGLQTVVLNPNMVFCHKYTVIWLKFFLLQ